MIPIAPSVAYARPPMPVSRFAQLISTRFTEKDGLTAGSVLTVQMSGQSVLVETDRGAFRFDGKRWIPEPRPPIHELPTGLTTKDVPPGDRVTSWARTRAGGIWAVTTRGATRRVDGRWQPVDLPKSYKAAQ